jgi:two-component system sensor histidine kinase AtoS
MVILEDYTKIEANKETALQDSKSELISLIAERFAHEIRNSLVPLSTHAQLIDKKIDQPKFQVSLKSAMLKEIARIKRFSEQMLYLAQASQTGGTELDLDDVLKKAFKRARNQAGNINAELVLDNEVSKAFLMGNPEAMTNAFEELFLNSMQAQPGEQTIQIKIQLNQEGILCLQWKDGGGGFSDEAIESAKQPFFTTRHTGVGLGLSVAEKIISEHHGFLRLNRRSEEQDWDLEIELPSLLQTVSP